MIDIFISYTNSDRQIAKAVAESLHEENWSVFWDRKIEPGAEWNEEIQRALTDARCVLVLWSKTSRNSFWVRGEATDSFERETYVPVLIDDSEPPKLFRHVQTISIARWVKQENTDELNLLKSSIKTRIGELPMYGNLQAVGKDQPVTDAHLHLIHSCWRVDKNTSFGFMPYQIHLIVYGHRSALDRIESVEYSLPGYPEGHDRQTGGLLKNLFDLKELANGFSIAQAKIRLHSQPPGYSKILRLSRFINMSESGPRLFDDFIRRVQ